MAIVASGQITLTDLNDSKQLMMYIGASQSRTVIFNGVSTYVPNYSTANQVLTPQLFIAGTSADIAQEATGCKWFVQVNGAGTPTEITANTADYTLTAVGTKALKTLTIKSNILASNTSMTYICELIYPDVKTGFNVTSKAEIEIVKVTNGTNGQNAVVAILSNEADNVPSDSNGNNQIVTGVNATITVYEGTTDVTASWSMGTPVVVGATGTFSGTPANRTWTLNANGMTSDSATVTWTLTRSGYASITKVFAISRVRNGVAGTSPTLYRLQPSANAIQRNISGVYSPSQLVLDAKSQTGSGAYGAYSGRFKIYTTNAVITSSTNWGTAVYTSASDQSTYTYSIPANIMGIKVELMSAGGSTLLDSQVIPVVVDGATGAPSVYAYVWTPDGNTIKNSTGSLTVHVDVYSGSNAVTGTGHKWYVQDPSATTASGGDADGGNGWRLVNATWNAGITNYSTDTITVPASAISGSESFKCVVTYNGTKYSGVATATDLTDPIMVRVDGLNIFKNGEGTVTLRASLFQSGEEIDSAGTGGYTYTWSIYNESNVKTAFAKTGKSITVNASDINGRGNVVCEVSK